MSSSLSLEGNLLNQVKLYKYLSVIQSHDVSWSEQVQSVCSKSRRILGLIYHQFYNNAPRISLVHLLLVRHHCDYASGVWSPRGMKDKAALDAVRFVVDATLLALEHQRLETRLCLLYKIMYRQCYFDNIFTCSIASLITHLIILFWFALLFELTLSYYLKSCLILAYVATSMYMYPCLLTEKITYEVIKSIWCRPSIQHTRY